jgi:hypothetical protein
MPMSRSDLPKDLEQGLNAHFGMEAQRLPEQWRQIYDIETSGKAQEEDVLEYGFGGAQIKSEGADIAEDKGGQSYSATYIHDTIALYFELTEEAIEDNLYHRLGPKYSKALATAFRHTKEIRGAQILNEATTTNGGDGVPLLSTAHPTAMAGDQSNRLATDADIAEASIEEMLIMIRRAKDDRGIPQVYRAERLVISPEEIFNAYRICKSVLRSGTANNDTNAHRAMGLIGSDPAEMNYLSDTNAWYIKTDCPNGMKHFVRVKMQRGMDDVFKTGNACYKGRERYSFGYSNWRGIYGTTGGS